MTSSNSAPKEALSQSNVGFVDVLQDS